MKRLVPEIPFPPYTFVPGLAPHPFSDPNGHSYGKRPPTPAPPDPERWWECREFLFGIDLFNGPAPQDASASRLRPELRDVFAGYYWEAHEAWEGLWHACGRVGPTADFLRGLIKLAAAGVKLREGVPHGAASHAARAAAIFRNAAGRLGGVGAHYFGLRVGDLLAAAHAAEAAAGEDPAPNGLRFVLVPQLPAVSPPSEEKPPG